MLLLGFFFTFFLPGFLLTEAFFKDLTKVEKIPLYFLLSVLFSTYLVYFVSLTIGFSLFSILLSFALFLPLLLFLKKQRLKSPFSKKHRLALCISTLIFLLFFVALYPAIFYKYRDYFAMSAVNWQDTAMHLSIIESISQGNFPPQAPYFSGHPLNYYYFTDFHTAILAKLGLNFFPQILIFDNPFFAFIFFLSLYAFAFYFTKKRGVSILAAFLGTFNGSFIFIRFFQDIFSLPEKNLVSILKLIAGRGYTIEYQKFFQVSPMADYFLQNRPMMVGLPAFTLSTLLVSKGLKEKNFTSLFLGSLITALLLKFQLFAFTASLLAFFLAFMFSGNKTKKVFFAFLFLPTIALIFLSQKSVNNQSFFKILKENLSFGPWDKTKTFFWYLKFYLANLGLSFLLTIPSFFLKPPFLKKQDLKFLLLLTFLLFLIPNVVKFTIYDGDMFKFFYLLVVPCSVVASCFLSQIRKKLLLLFIFLLLISSFTSLLTLSWSFLNKNFAYSFEDLGAGLWIRKNTQPQSVFIGLPTVHSPITQIGGRLRVLSYINWPYSHGFNRGEDNVFSRLEDIKKLYQGNEEEILKIMNKYQAQYVFYGPEEKNKFPEAEKRFEESQVFTKVYQNQKIQIYRINKT